MDRRELLSMFTIATAGASVTSDVIAQERRTHLKQGHPAGRYDAAAKVSSRCADACSSCFDHCASFVVDGQKHYATAMFVCNDCAVFCRAVAELCSRGSELTHHIGKACMKACEHCASICAKFPDDEHMQSCATNCRECSAICRDLAEPIDIS